MASSRDGVGPRFGRGGPRGRALLVANHAFGFDIAFAVARIQVETGRRVWSLGEHAWWSVPAVRRLAAAVGIVDGTTENVDEGALHEIFEEELVRRARGRG